MDFNRHTQIYTFKLANSNLKIVFLDDSSSEHTKNNSKFFPSDICRIFIQYPYIHLDVQMMT